MKCYFPDLQIMNLVPDLAIKNNVFLGNKIKWV